MMFPASGNLMLSFRVALMSTGLLSLAIILKLLVLPFVTVFVVTEEEEDIFVHVSTTTYVNDSVVASDRYGNYEYLGVEDKTVIVEDCTMESGEVYETEVDKPAPYRSGSIEFLIEKDQNKEKPMVSARLGRRKSLKGIPRGYVGGREKKRCCHPGYNRGLAAGLHAGENYPKNPYVD
ncbi:hypothetical protein SADUNF_Sadunf10G0087600 [Salix dunnii]|uniref:Uncharacterized protein n=1 Tax=Salix dunnii TaxID=1413687 RepID=A0A835JVI1_9ROSI|nr:hypothetical protein SADUNF_Sadunf10G0087600 [Salix dunnii]